MREAHKKPVKGYAAERAAAASASLNHMASRSLHAGGKPALEKLKQIRIHFDNSLRWASCALMMQRDRFGARACNCLGRTCSDDGFLSNRKEL